jgi:hypothetical protein
MAKNVLKGNKYGAGFDKNPQNINKTGANGRTVTKVLKELLNGDYIELELTIIDKDGQKKTQKLNLQSKNDLNTAIATVLLSKALKGDLRAITEILDRTEGKPQQHIEQNTNINIQPPDPFAKIRENHGIDDKAKTST